MSGSEDPQESRRALLEERLADYRAGRLSQEETQAFEREVLTNQALADALYADMNLIAAIDQVANDPNRTVVPMPRWWQRRPAQIVAPLAAAALALLVLWPADRGRDGVPVEPTFRSADGATRIVRPLGDLDDVPSQFVWTRDAGAAMYRVELYDTSGQLLHRSTTPDTTLVLPEDVLSDGAFQSGYWKVIPMNDAGIERPSPTPASIRLRP